MKRLPLLLAAVLCVAGASAQQALWSASKIVSPQINGDNSVTFRLKAPEAKSAVVVCDYTAADGTPLAPGKMVRGEDGVWEFTTPPLMSELYSYNFVVDGVKVCDPANVYINRDVASVANIFIIGGDRGDLYRVNDVPHGSVKRCWYDSPTLGKSRRMTVYTPAGYEQGREKYPVLYLLHGAGGDEEAWMTLGRTSQILDNLIAQGKCRPMIVVMTNGNPWQQAAPGEAADGMKQPGMKFDPSQTSVEESFGEVIAYVEDNYRVIRKKEARAVAGLSMGGGGALKFALNCPEIFGAGAVLSYAPMELDSLSDEEMFTQARGGDTARLMNGVNNAGGIQAYKDSMENSWRQVIALHQKKLGIANVIFLLPRPNPGLSTVFLKLPPKLGKHHGYRTDQLRHPQRR